MAKIDKQYHQIAQAIIDSGYDYTTENRPTVPCRQITSVNLDISLEEFPLLTTKKMFTKGVSEELLWFLRGDTHVSSLIQKEVHIWDDDAYRFYEQCYDFYPLGKDKLSFEDWLEKQKTSKPTHSGDVGRNYGHQWRKWTTMDWINGQPHWAPEVDQIEGLLHNLRRPNPMTRRHIVTAWNPAELDYTALSPCHWAFEILPRPLSSRLKIQYSGGDQEYLETLWLSAYGKDNNLEAKALLEKETAYVPNYGFVLKWHQRSVDTFLGLPFNIASYALLAHIIGSIIDMIPMSIIGDLSNVHFYQPHIELVKKQLDNSPIAFSGCQLRFSDYYLGWLDKYKKGECSFDDFIDQLSHEDFIFENYQSFPAIKGDMYSPTN